MYDTCEWHRANSFYNGDGEDARLTLSFFIGGINVNPLKRIKNSEYESTIKSQVGAMSELPEIIKQQIGKK